MSLGANNVDIKKVIFNGTEVNALKFNGSGCYGRPFSFTQSNSSGVSFSINRTSSPNQQAGTGYIAAGYTLYYGDTVSIGITANANYINPRLFADIGDGRGLLERTAPFTFTVNNNVTFYGTATFQDNWETVWSGSERFTADGSFSVPGPALSGDIQISAEIEFASYLYNPSSDNTEMGTDTQSLTNEILPTTVYSDGASVYLSRDGNQITFTGTSYSDEYKGYVFYAQPTAITITKVRREA